MSPIRDGFAVLALGFPRVSGDEPRKMGAGTAWRWFSPRERG